MYCRLVRLCAQVLIHENCLCSGGVFLMIVNIMVPARKGSQRLPKKNLAIINGRPMISYVVSAVKESNITESIFINTDDERLRDVAKSLGVDFYLRDEKIASSETRSDEVIYDFMKNNPGDYTIWANSIAPLQTSQEITNCFEYFKSQNFDGLITCHEESVHCLYNDRPLNFELNEPFALTQGLTPLKKLVYSLMMWKNESFIKNYEQFGHAMLLGNIGFFPVSKESSIIVKTAEDLKLIEAIVKGKEITSSEVEYYS